MKATGLLFISLVCKINLRDCIQDLKSKIYVPIPKKCEENN
jgi:hypothetical protein